MKTSTILTSVKINSFVRLKSNFFISSALLDSTPTYTLSIDKKPINAEQFSIKNF